MRFNAENQITQMDAGAAVYGYDGEGRRVKKATGLYERQEFTTVYA